MLTARGVGGAAVAIGDAGPNSSGPDDSVTSIGSCAQQETVIFEYGLQKVLALRDAMHCDCLKLANLVRAALG